MDTITPLEIPESHLGMLRKSDLLPSKFDDARRYPRRYWVREGTLECVEPFVKEGRTSAIRTILTTDISRGGLRFLCGDKLESGEVIRVTLAEGKSYRMQIAWSEEINSACFQAGAVFVKQR